MSACPARERGQQRREGYGLVGQLEAEAVADRFAKVDVEADIIAGVLGSIAS